MIRFDIKWVLTLLFAALGPLGNILTPQFFPPSFRTYYFFLPLFPFFYFWTKERVIKFGIFCLPFLIYCFVSAVIVENFGSPNEPHTFFRFILLFCQFYFILGAASHIKEQKSIYTILKTYLIFYFISTILGYIMFSGYYLKIFSLEILSRFSVLTQFGFGILRFSPGSYPNEYGIVSSFVLSVLILIALKNKLAEFRFSKKLFFSFLFASFFALLLTTTRAAYLSFLTCIFYIAWRSDHFLKIALSLFLSLGLCFSLLLIKKVNMFEIFAAGLTQNFTEGSLRERYMIWLETAAKAIERLFWGSGFASLTNLHNVYLQLFFELGLMGIILAIGSLSMALFEYEGRYKKIRSDPFLSKVRMVGLINILSFAASNHNLNHHLTWFVCFLCFTALNHPSLETSKQKNCTSKNGTAKALSS